MFFAESLQNVLPLHTEQHRTHPNQLIAKLMHWVGQICGEKLGTGQQQEKCPCPSKRQQQRSLRLNWDRLNWGDPYFAPPSRAPPSPPAPRPHSPSAAVLAVLASMAALAVVGPWMMQASPPPPLHSRHIQ